MRCEKGILHLVNECGYPSTGGWDSVAIIKLCADIIHSGKEQEGGEEGEERLFHYFYTSDVKMLVEIVVRELRNIPFAEEGSSDASSPSFAVFRMGYCIMDSIRPFLSYLILLGRPSPTSLLVDPIFRAYR